MISTNDAAISLIQCNGKIPNPRISFLSLLLPKDEILIHGGNDEFTEYSDLYILNLSKRIWRQLFLKIEIPLSGHSGIMISFPKKSQNSIWIFGGFDGKDYSSTSYLMNLNTGEVKRNEKPDNIESIKLSKSLKKIVDSESSFPEARKDQTVLFSKKSSKIVLFGGCNVKMQIQERKPLTEIWQLDSTWRWQMNKIEEGDIQPFPVKGHSMNILNNNIFIFGGITPNNKLLDTLYIFDFKLNKWKINENLGSKPSARAYHRSVASKEAFFIIGGYTIEGISNQVLEFSVEKQEWREINCLQQKLFIPVHSFGLIPISNHSLIIIGGKTEEKMQIFSQITEIKVPEAFFLNENSLSILENDNVNWNTVLFGKENSITISKDKYQLNEREIYEEFSGIGEQEFN